MIDETRLDAILASVGAHLDVEPNGGAGSAPRRRWPPLVAASALLVMIGVVTVAPAREALGGWLRLGRTEIHADVDVALPVERLPAFVEAATPIAPSRAASALGAQLPDLVATPLGAPAAWVAPGEGGVIAVWPDGVTLWLVPLDAGGPAWFDKVVATSGQVTEVDGLGSRAVAVSGEHLMQTPLRRVAAASSVLWLDGDVVYRLEADQPIDALISLARAVAVAS